MRPTTLADRKFECLATAVTLVFGTCALRFALALPYLKKVLYGDERGSISPLLTRLVFQNSGWITAGVVMVIAVTFVAIWSRHRFSVPVAAGGIIILGILPQILWTATTSVWWSMVGRLDG